MNCPSSGTLRAYLDHELDSTESAAVEQHSAECATCRAQLQAFSTLGTRVALHLKSLEDTGAEPLDSPAAALARFKSSVAMEEPAVPFYARLFSPRWRLAWAASLTAAILLISLAFPSARGFAQRLLATLRVEKIQTIPIDFASLDRQSNRGLQQTLSKMISDNIVVTTDEKPLHASSFEEASKLAGFTVRRLPGRTDSPSFDVEGAHAFHMSVDRTRLQEVLDQAGRTDLILPAKLDGAMLSVNVPRVVGVTYGTCEARHPRMQESPAPSQPANSSDCLVLIQAPSPTLDVPADLNLQQLAETAMQLAGMDAVQARKFCQSIDWKTTLVLPMPRFVGSYETVTVNGAQGTLMHTPSRSGPTSSLIWVEDGTIYALLGSYDKQKTLELANSLE